MAIQFARIEISNRSSGANACCKGAYNARTQIRDNQSNISYNFSDRGDNVYHNVLLPDYVDQKFKDTSVLMNAVEVAENRKNSQLLKDIVIALPDDKEFSLQDKINITHEIIDEMEWVKNGLAVQVDIHEPHDGEKNWHAHLLVTTRRFIMDGSGLGAKARDMNPEFKSGKGGNFIIPEEDIIHEKWKRIINDYSKRMGYEARVDEIGLNPQEHIGPVRMRSVMNAAVMRNEERRLANIENLASGEDLLRYVSKHMSVFDKNDLMRAVKIVPKQEKREALIAKALADKSLVVLYEEDGKESRYYTTRDIRKEEEKILRLSGYVAQESNVLLKGSYKQMSIATALVEEAKNSGQLTQEQYEALSHMLFTRSGVRVLRGRAGTGKSHVLGKLATIAEAAGLTVIGLAPTHKARTEIAARGYANNDTVKGMLFKHYNGRFELPKGSLIVVDEAGMVGNDDYQELLRVVAANKCNIILAGDERQLSSVQRGGMYEVFDREYGSALIANIQRQNTQWGRDVAMAFSNGEIRSGVKVLHEQGKIIEHDDKQSSMQGLIEDWSKSDKKVEDRLIIAISNKDVAALNHGVRQYLKPAGKLTGDEIRVGACYYQKGDRILITETNKALGLTNGDYAQVVEATADRFVITKGSSDNKVQEDMRDLLEFNPKDYGGFKHGYATTVFKAQGASISDVYVYHAGYGWTRKSYVALSRSIDEMKLYVNKESTKSIDQLVRQLGNNTYEGSSLIYQTKEDIAAKEAKAQENANASNKGILGSIWKGFDKVAEVIGSGVVKWADKNIELGEYYKYDKPEIKQHIVEEVLAEVYEEVAAKEGYQEQKAVGAVGVGGNSGKVRLFGSSNTGVNKSVAGNKVINASNTKVALTPKEKFYANRERLKQSEINKQRRKEEWNRDQERLRSEVRYKVEDIARDLLGPENKRLSQKNSLRWGEHGKLAMHIRGERAGIWCDFSSGKGGDIFDLVQEIRKSDFRAAVEYLEATVGFKKSTSPNLKLVYDHNNSDVLAKALKQREEEVRIEKQKKEQVIKLYDRSKEIGDKSIAYRYLKEARGIDCQLREDIRTAGIYVKNQGEIKSDGTSNIKANITGDKGKYYPALIAFARNKEGDITGGQQILLDKQTAKKADLAVVKKSFGKISGSFVDLSGEQDNRKAHMNDRSDRITIIAEGLETALSVKQALSNEQIEHSDKTTKNILCSLGISNIRNYQPMQGEKIIIAADNDGENNITSKTIATAKEELEQRGAFVEIVMPSKEGDFNDVLQQEGEKEIQNAFKDALTRMKETALQQVRINEEFGKLEKAKSQAKTVEEVLTVFAKEQQLSNRLAKELPAIFEKLADRKLNTDPKLIESVKRESEFLIKNNIVSEKALVQTMQNSKDLKLTASDMFNECKRHAQRTTMLAVSRVERLDELEKEEDVVKLLNDNKTKYQEFAPYLKDTAERRLLEHLGTRLRVYEIAEEDSRKYPEQSQNFKEEMQALYRFSKLGMEAALKTYEKQGLEKAVSVAKETNIDKVLSHLGSQSDILNSQYKLKGKAYIEEAAKDKTIMKYVDAALSKGGDFDSSLVKNNNLLDYTNQRDINETLEKFKGSPSERQLFKENIDNLQRFGQSKDLRDGVMIFKEKGINALVRHTDTACTRNVLAKISKDFINIFKGQPVELLDGKYREKSDYLAAIGKDENVMKYIALKSDIGQEIEKQKQSVQTQQIKRQDFEK